MANTINSANMNLPIPVVGVDPTPTWGNDLNSCLTLLDAHSHQPGYGVPITPDALNINADLTFANNNLTNAKTLGFFTQTVDPTSLGLLYYKGVDLYFNDGSSNHIRMTSGGSVTGATGTITGLPSGTASASYNAGTFVFQSATNTAANVDGQTVILRNSSASSKGLTLTPPAAMGSDFSLTLPTVPAQTNVMTLTSGGVMGSATYDAIRALMSPATQVTASQLVATTAAATTVYSDLISISVPAGTWNITANQYFTQNTAAARVYQSGISTTAGNFSTGLQLGTTLSEIATVSTNVLTSASLLVSYTFTFGGTTTVYLKSRVDYSSGAPQSIGSITATKL